jgi:hypothetical protein
MDDKGYEQLMEIDQKRRVPDSDYVFADQVSLQRGQPILDIKNAWKTATKNAGISNFRFHDRLLDEPHGQSSSNLGCPSFRDGAR